MGWPAGATLAAKSFHRFGLRQILVVGAMLVTLFLARFLMPVLYSFYGDREPPKVDDMGH